VQAWLCCATPHLLSQPISLWLPTAVRFPPSHLTVLFHQTDVGVMVVDLDLVHALEMLSSPKAVAMRFASGLLLWARVLRMASAQKATQS
jgi:hypothetical protein